MPWFKPCDNCIRRCKGGRGFCGHRDENGGLKDPSGYLVGKVDNLADKPILRLPNRKLFSVGSYGCNFRCEGCQNSWISQAKNPESTGYVFTMATPEQIVEYALEQKCEGLCYTYNEPAVWLERIREIAEEAKGAGLCNFLVTNSTLTSLAVDAISPLLDGVATDIKSMRDDFFRKYCGITTPNVARQILSCIESFHKKGVHVETRTNVIPGANDSLEGLRDIAEWIRDHLGKGAIWHVTSFFPAHNLSHLSRTPIKTLHHAEEIGLSVGLEVVIHSERACDAFDTGSIRRCLNKCK